MFNKDNLVALDEQGFDYILGSRIKNLPNKLTKQILNSNNYQSINSTTKIARFSHNGRILLVSHSQKRAKKDKANREQGIAKLRDKLAKHKSPKEYLSNQGYKKYLQLSDCEGSITLNEDKISQACKWDGLKAYVINANSNLSNNEILEQYNNLWQVEKSFRITEHDLKIRPIYHWKPRRVKAHLAISFAAYMLIRHLEYRVKLQYKQLSPESIRQLLLSVQVSLLFDKKLKKKFILPSNICVDAKKIYSLMDVAFKTKPYVM